MKWKRKWCRFSYLSSQWLNNIVAGEVISDDSAFKDALYIRLSSCLIPTGPAPRPHKQVMPKSRTLSEQCQGFFYIFLPADVHGYLKETRPMVSRHRAMTPSSDLKNCFNRG